MDCHWARTNQRGQVEGLTAPSNPVNNPVVGAVTAIVTNPTNANVVYIGTANGGIWKTTDATDANPFWLPLTDQQPSLGISALAMDPSNPNTLYAGTGSISSSGSREPGVGLLKTTDGGSTWSVLGNTKLANAVITSIVPTSTGQVLVAAESLSSNTFSYATSGFLVSHASANDPTDPSWSNNWTDLSFKADATPNPALLPPGPVTDPVADPATPTRIYAAVPGKGVFKSTDSGNTWLSINTAALVGPAGSAARIKLAVAGRRRRRHLSVDQSRQQLDAAMGFRDGQPPDHGDQQHCL